MYIVTLIKHSAYIKITEPPRETAVRIDFAFADGMVGVLPVFAKYEDAVKYADGKADVIEIER